MVRRVPRGKRVKGVPNKEKQTFENTCEPRCSSNTRGAGRRFSSRILAKRVHDAVENDLCTTSASNEVNQNVLQQVQDSDIKRTKRKKCNSVKKDMELKVPIYGNACTNQKAKVAEESNTFGEIKCSTPEVLKGCEKSEVNDDTYSVEDTNRGICGDKCINVLKNTHGSPKKCGGDDPAGESSKGTSENKSGNATSGGKVPLFSRSFIFSDGTSTVHDSSQSSEDRGMGTQPVAFSLVTYNILADCHAQRDYNVPGSWISSEDLSMDSRHKRLFEELKWLNADIICLQEVGSDYFKDILEPCLKDIGYSGLYVSRLGFPEGEATFFKAAKFRLECSKSLLLKDVIAAEIKNLGHIDHKKWKKSLSASIDSYAVSLLTRLESIENNYFVTVANVHIAYDFFKRQDKQCLQIAATVRELQQMSGDADCQVICGDFNSWPSSPPQQLICKGHLDVENVRRLQDIVSIDVGYGEELTPLFDHLHELFHFNPAPDYRSAYKTITGTEPYTSRFNSDGIVRQVDFIYYSNSSHHVRKVLSVPDQTLIQGGVPNSIFPSDHLSLMAEFMLTN